MNTTGKQCRARNKRGEPCAAWTVSDSGYCFWHNPDDVERRRLARKKGGKARHGRAVGSVGDAGPPVELKSIDDVLALIERAVNDALVLENSLSRSRVLGYLAGIASKTLELSELTRRIEALERLANGQI